MLRLRDIFLRKLAWIFLILFVVLGASLYFWIKDIYIEEAKKDLLHSIAILTVSQTDLHDIDRYVHDIRDKSGIRVTIIDPDGRVVAESNKDKRSMDNHKFRDEVIAARQHPYGYAIRHSKTLDRELLYVAKQTEISGKPYVVRMAREVDEIIASFVAVSIKTAILLGLFALFAYRMILGIGSGVQRETEKILHFLDDMGSKEKDRSISSNYSIEFKRITKLLTETSQKLSKRRKQKSKYTARLKLANRQKDDIISAISHEFKNPIAVISGYTQTLIEDKEISPAIAEKFLSKIHSNAHKLAEMIDRLRLSVKLDEQKQPLKLSQTDIVALAHAAVEALRSSYPDREVRILGLDSHTVEADATLMEIAITNLIENAIKYSDDMVEVEITPQSLLVQDNGIGIPHHDIMKITQKFYRVSGNSWDNSMGIGLSLVANIMQLHGMTLHVQSQEGKGSLFEIRFASQ